jgi:hypothetical protein
MELGTIADWFSGAATFIAAGVALYLGLRKQNYLQLSLQPHNIANLNVNSLDMFVFNGGPQIALVRNFRLRVSLIHWRFCSIAFYLPDEWHAGAHLPSTIRPGDVSSAVLHPSPLTAGGPATQWMIALGEKRWFQIWKFSPFQHLTLLAYTQDGSVYKLRLKGEVRQRMRNALAI